MSKSKNIAERIANRIAKHPMYSPSDLKYLRKKGYSDEEILAFWDRDHGMGHKPLEHRFSYSGSGEEVLKDVLRDSFSPQAVAAISAYLRSAETKVESVNKEISYMADLLMNMVGVDEYNRLIEEVGL